jgi:F-type H+-transporting ATPase subunit delta
LGGIVIRVGDTIYDSSLALRIKQLRERLRQRSLHEIQSGRDRFGHPEGD